MNERPKKEASKNAFGDSAVRQDGTRIFRLLNPELFIVCSQDPSSIQPQSFTCKHMSDPFASSFTTPRIPTPSPTTKESHKPTVFKNLVHQTCTTASLSLNEWCPHAEAKPSCESCLYDRQRRLCQRPGLLHVPRLPGHHPPQP